MAKNNLKKLKLNARILKNQMIWFGSGLISKISLSKRINGKQVLPKDILKNVLILAPHADDEWIGCSQVIKKSNNSTVYYFNFLGNNYNSDNERIRLEELKKISDATNFNLIVSSDREDHSDLKKIINDNNVSAIFIPFPLDWHPEHILVNDIAIEIFSRLENLPPLYFYHISVPIPEGIKSCFYLPMSKKETQEKIETFDYCYVSQKNTPIRRLVLQNKIWAQGQKFYAAENYAKLELNEWKKFLNFVHENFSQIKQTIHIIDSPLRIRKLSNNLYIKFNRTQFKLSLK